jgi:hypothetical protein
LVLCFVVVLLLPSQALNMQDIGYRVEPFALRVRSSASKLSFLCFGAVLCGGSSTIELT